jgi:hypothetical protein
MECYRQTSFSEEVVMNSEKGPKNIRCAGLVTIDVEPDNVWRDTYSEELKNIASLPKFHSLCQEFGVRPTYLVSYSVAQDSKAANLLQTLLSKGDCEIGAHPHLWETPPILPIDRSGQALTGPMYSADILQEKLGNLQALLTSRFGAPTSHRAGRYGMDIRQIDILNSLGMNVDTSVTPGLEWPGTGAPSYLKAPISPYFLSKRDLNKPGDSSVLEVPCTIRPGMNWMGFEKNRLLQRLRNRIGWGPKWLRCSPNSDQQDLLDICQWGLGKVELLNVMTHSSELSAGTSPYWKTEDDAERHYALYRSIFKWWELKKIKPQTLSEFASPIHARRLESV